jgi:small subunit ribosomal protein S9
MGKPALSAFLMTLQDALKASRASLYRAGYLASVDAPSSLPGQVPSAKWITAEEMATQLQISRITLSYYRKITALLIELNNLHPLLNKLDNEALAGVQGNAAGIEGMLKRFKKPDARNIAILGQGGEITLPQKSRKQGYLDPNTGIAYGLGKKKESSVRAWIVPVQSSTNTSSPEAKEQVDLGPKNVFSAIQDQTQDSSTLVGSSSSSSSSAKPPSPTQEVDNDDDFSFTPPPRSNALSLRSKSGIAINDVPIGRILCNNLPISSYFHTAAERSVVMRPFSLTECIGKYNVFLLLRGGGVSSQATAASVACARALAAAGLEEGHPERKAILSKGEFVNSFRHR